MSSLLQFGGTIDKRGVGLLGYLKKPGTIGEPVEEIPCGICGRTHPELYEFFRKPRGMLGCWVVFRYNGENQVTDLSIPIWLDKIPRGARKLDEETTCQYWHSE